MRKHTEKACSAVKEKVNHCLVHDYDTKSNWLGGVSSKKMVWGTLDHKLIMNQTDHTGDVQREVLHLRHESMPPEYSEDWYLSLGKALASIFCPLWQETCSRSPKQTELNGNKTTGDINE